MIKYRKFVRYECHKSRRDYDGTAFIDVCLDEYGDVYIHELDRNGREDTWYMYIDNGKFTPHRNRVPEDVMRMAMGLYRDFKLNEGE